MSKLYSKFLDLFRPRTLAGVDKGGNQYFTRVAVIGGIVKEKRWVIFKGEQDPTSIPVEWICWLNGQRKKAPTVEEMAELEARREAVKQNVALLKKKEEEERKSGVHQTKKIDKGSSPDIKSFIRQFPQASLTPESGESPVKDAAKDAGEKEERSSEPTGTGMTYKPGTWQPPT